MQVVETNSDSLLKDFKVTVAASDIEARIDSRLTEVGADARIPGFRPGKAPVSILKQRFGPAVRGEVLEAALRDGTQELLAERGLRPASQPQIEVTSYEEGNDLEYDVSVELLPDMTTSRHSADRLVLQGQIGWRRELCKSYKQKLKTSVGCLIIGIVFLDLVGAVHPPAQWLVEGVGVYALPG